MSGPADPPVRVLHVYPGNLYGGVERMLATYAGLRAEATGLEPAFALCFDGRLAEEVRAAGAPLEVLGDVRFSRPWTVIRARRALRRLMQRERPDVVLCHSSWSHALFARTVREAGVPLAFGLHDRVTGRTWADRLAARTAPDVAACTSAFAAETLARLWPHVRGEVVYPPVPRVETDGSDRAALRLQLRTGAGDVVILQASRMEPWKGHALLLRALGTMRDVGGWTCWIAGGAQRPHEEAHLAEMFATAQQLGIAPRIRFLGHRNDVPALMRAADVLCQPNRGPEPFGIAFVEAMHAGLPVVATDIGGAREIVDAACGIRVPPEHPAALGEALRTLVADAGLRARLGSAGPAHARALADPVRQAVRLRDVLARVVRPPPPGE